MYEVEYKVEISKEKSEELAALFEKSGYSSKPAVPQSDYYIQADPSPLGGFDLKRYREEGMKAFYTEKIWEAAGGGKARREIEKEVSVEELRAEVRKFPDAIKIQKLRRAFSGEYKGKKIHIDMDSVKFDHSPAVRYFIEAELIAEKKEDVKLYKEFLIGFLKEVLRTEELREAPGMFTMAREKK